jgi:gamma-aminobutyric acid receptor subunit beta
MKRLFRQFFPAIWSAVLLVGFVAPPSESAEISRPTDLPLKVHVTIFIIDVDDINGASQSFDANVHIQYRWQDPRLAHNGKKSIVTNIDEIWNPSIQIINQQKIWLTLPDTVKISPDGNVLYHQRAWGSFSQPLKLHDFPFDRQSFSIQLATIDYTPSEIELVQDKDDESGMAEDLSVADWGIIGFKAEPRPYKPSPALNAMAGFVFTFEAKREAGYFIIKVIIPLILIVAMSWVVFWIDPIESGTQISVAITTMLTLIAYRFAIDTDLPKISYLTRMDFFILLSTILVYASLIEVVVTSALTKDGKISQARTLDRWMHGCFPRFLPS